MRQIDTYNMLSDVCQYYVIPFRSFVLRALVYIVKYISLAVVIVKFKMVVQHELIILLIIRLYNTGNHLPNFFAPASYKPLENSITQDKMYLSVT